MHVTAAGSELVFCILNSLGRQPAAAQSAVPAQTSSAAAGSPSTADFALIASSAPGLVEEHSGFSPRCILPQADGLEGQAAGAPGSGYGR